MLGSPNLKQIGVLNVTEVAGMRLGVTRFGMGHPRGVIEIVQSSQRVARGSTDHASGGPSEAPCGGLARRRMDCQRFGAAGVMPGYRVWPTGRSVYPVRAAFFRSSFRRVLEAEGHRRQCDSVRGTATGARRQFEWRARSRHLLLGTHAGAAECASARACRGARRSEDARRTLNNAGFEVAVAWYEATGERTLLDPAIKTAAALYEDFKVRKPPFSGGERDAINCLRLYHATRDKKHLDLAKHYLDIRGLESSVNRSRHNQSYAPVLQQSEAVGHAVNCATLMVALADVGVLTGLRAYLDAAQRMG
jgi:hypothetical protein